MERLHRCVCHGWPAQLNRKAKCMDCWLPCTTGKSQYWSPGALYLHGSLALNPHDSKGGKTKRVNMWSAWKWLIALAVKALWWSRGEWLGKTKRLHRFTLGLHFSLVWTPFKWNALHWRWDRGDFGFVHRLFSMNLSRSLSYTKIVKRIGLCKWSGGVPDALPFFILSKLFHIDDIWYICNEINTVYYE